VLAVVVVVAAVMSAPPTTHVAGLRIPGPSTFIYSVLPSWRVYSRFFIVVHAALVPIAAVGLALLLRRRRLVVQAVAGAVVVGLVLFEFLPLTAPGVWRYADAPEAYRFLAAQPERTIAEYPMQPAEGDLDHAYLTYQPIHQKAMVNVRNTTTPANRVVRTLAGLADPGTLPVLRAYGVGFVVVHRSRMPGGLHGPIPAGLELVRSDSFDSLPVAQKKRLFYLNDFYDIDVYRVMPGRVARFAIAQDAGFYLPEPNGWSSSMWMDGTATIHVVGLGSNSGSAAVSFRAAAAFGEVRQLVVEQNGHTLFDGTIKDATLVRFVARPDAPITIRTSPGGEVIHDRLPNLPDPRRVAVSVQALVVEPA
jgi:hypothetical protein